jgi:hypothetical protein
MKALKPLLLLTLSCLPLMACAQMLNSDPLPMPPGPDGKPAPKIWPAYPGGGEGGGSGGGGRN